MSVSRITFLAYKLFNIKHTILQESRVENSSSFHIANGWIYIYVRKHNAEERRRQVQFHLSFYI